MEQNQQAPKQQTEENHQRAQTGKIDWAKVTAALPTGMDETSKERRKQIFRAMDGNGSGQLSKAEIDGGIPHVLGLSEFYRAKPAIHVAYKVAKGAKSKDDFVSWKEFRVLLKALRHYFELWSIFEEIDADGDRRVTIAEFSAVVPKLNEYGANISDAQEAFAEIDSNHGGKILFDEFASWATKKHLDRTDDDDADEGDLPEPQGFTLHTGPLDAPGKSPLKPSQVKAGATLDDIFGVPAPPKPKINWPAVTAKLPAGDDEVSRAQRKQLFNAMDMNGNGFLSKAEIDRAVLVVLGLNELFLAKPAIHVAYKVAKGVKEKDDWVDRREFKVLLKALRHYFEMWSIFSETDRDGDRRVTKEEFRNAVPRLREFGAQIDDADVVFSQIDTDHGGMILFDEFALWANNNHLDRNDDDDADDGNLPPAEGFKMHKGPLKPIAADQPKTVPKVQKIKIDWPAVTAKFPTGPDMESKQARKKLFSQMDGNGSGQLSLAEIDGGIRDVLGLTQLFHAKPAIMVAYKVAKGADSTDYRTDWVNRKEFPVLLKALRHYFELWSIFEEVDTDRDRKISKEEFLRAIPDLNKYHAQITDAETTFAQIDANNGGKISFDEFAVWANKQRVDRDDDDDADDYPLPDAQPVGGQGIAPQAGISTTAQDAEANEESQKGAPEAAIRQTSCGQGFQRMTSEGPASCPQNSAAVHIAEVTTPETNTTQQIWSELAAGDSPDAVLQAMPPAEKSWWPVGEDRFGTDAESPMQPRASSTSSSTSSSDGDDDGADDILAMMRNAATTPKPGTTD